jgi:hypothetical protein
LSYAQVNGNWGQVREIAVDEHDALEGNVHEYTYEYLMYVMLADTKLISSPPSGAREATHRYNVIVTLVPYFNWAFWGKDDGRTLSPWSNYLWHLRSELGDEYTDKLVSTMLRTFIDTPLEGENDKFDIYFCQHLRTAFGVVDNGSKKWSDVLQGLGSEPAAAVCPAS